MVRLQTSDRMMNIIQVYATTNDMPNKEVKAFYNDRLSDTSAIKQITLVIEHFKPKIGSGTEDNILGKYEMQGR